MTLVPEPLAVEFDIHPEAGASATLPRSNYYHLVGILKGPNTSHSVFTSCGLPARSPD